MLKKLRHFINNAICGLIPGRDRRRRVRVVLNSDMVSHLRFIHDDLGTPPKNIRTFVGYQARSLLISVNDKYIYKVPLQRDNADDLAQREKRIIDALAPLSPIYVPSVTLLNYDGHIVRKYEFIPGVQFRKLSTDYANAHLEYFAAQIAEFMYNIGCANPHEIADLKPSQTATPAYQYGWSQGDIYDNFLIDTKTNKIIAMIDWEDAFFGNFGHLFHRNRVSIASRFMDAVLKEYNKLYYKNN